MLFAELVLRLHRVCRNADDIGLGLSEGAPQPVERDGLLGATWRVRLWVEIQNHGLAPEL